MSIRSALLGAILTSGVFVGAISPASARTPEVQAPRATPDTLFAAADEQAAKLASQPYRKPPQLPSGPFQHLDYDGYRKLRPQPDRALWGQLGEPFAILPLPAGGIFQEGVNINVVVDGVVWAANDLSSIIDFVDFPNATDAERASLGSSGFQVITKPLQAGVGYEAAVFQGASYFRAVNEGFTYGASARALAINTGLWGEMEEFPRFTDFWIVRPSKADDAIVLVALIDSPSLAGAYRITIRPGQTTITDVEAVIHPREDVAEIGLAPLSSMFMRGPADAAAADPRPQVHDSDGLTILAQNGERIWRPLANPRAIEISDFAGPAPKGFGLEQRSRWFSAYKDSEAQYDRRPSVWIEPGEGWGEGVVRLVEIPTPNEYNDNIVSLWRPSQPWKAGEARRVSWRLNWLRDPPANPAISRVISTRITPRPDGLQHVEIDFESPAADARTPDVWAGAGVVSRVSVIEEHGYRRLTFDLDPKGARAVELHAALRGPASQLTETWLFKWTRE